MKLAVHLITPFIFNLFIFLLFLTPSGALAATIAYEITKGVVAYQISARGEVFFEKNLTIEYKSGKIIFSSNPDGTGQTFADDAVVMTIIKRGGGTMKFEHHYEKNCQALDPAPPKDITNYFPGEGTYDINVKLKDVCYYYVAANPMYLVNINAPEPSVSPTPTPPEPFLDLPWNYDCKQAIDEKLNEECECKDITNLEEKNECESEKRILDFNIALFKINSWFDHEYPLQNEDEFISKIRAYDGIEKPYPYRSHSGYDYGRPVGIKINTPVLAPADGWASYDNSCRDCGNMIKITHDNGYQTWYEHLDSNGLVVNTVGEKSRVVKGQKIGEVGMTGKTTGPHIHFSVFNLSKFYPYGLVDPLGWEGKDAQGNPAEDPWIKIGGARSYRLFTKHPPDDTKQIPQTGGQLKSGDGDTTINVPQNATNSAFTLTHKKGSFESYQKEGITIESIMPSFFLDALNSAGEKITQFREAFEIVVKYEPLNIKYVKESTLAGYYFNEIINEWTPLPSIVDEVYNTITFYTTHNSQFAVMGEAIDKTAPTTKIFISGVKGQDTWYSSDVQVDLIGEDNEGGLGLEYTLFTLDGNNWDIYDKAFNFTKEQEYILTYQSFDTAGNEGERHTDIIRIDKTSPIVNASIDRNSDQDGWYNKPLSISFNGTDNGSGIDQCSDTIIYDGPDTNNAVIDGNCTNKAGHIATTSFEFKYDSTPPVLTASASSNGKPYASGLWTNSDVEITFNCIDEISGVKSVAGPVTASSEGKDQSVQGECVDNAGNKSEIKFDGINIDKTAPVVSIQATPDSIWPPNGKMVNVVISGSSSDENINITEFEVIDEYNEIYPLLTEFGQTIQFKAHRDGDDKDGRKYVIRANAVDMAGNKAVSEATVIVPHDKGK